MKKKPRKSSPQRVAGLTGSLLGNWPPGFEDGGRRLLAECPEFKLFELYCIGGRQIVESSTTIEEAEMGVLMRIKEVSRGEWGKRALKRILAARAISRLIEYKKVTSLMSDFLVPELEKAYSLKNPEALKKAARNIGTMVEDAVLANLRRDGLIPDGRATHLPAPAVMIWVAQSQFVDTKKRPTKSYVKRRMEEIGYTINGKDSAARWRERFMKAALDELPE
jgi:hypothetical protein